MSLHYPIEQFKKFKESITRFMMVYKFALDEMETKVKILNEEFHLLHDYNPIEHTKTRIKSPESIIEKLVRKGCEMSLPSIKRNIQDIAGMRITCSFVSDIYRISEMLGRQHDLNILEVKDYIKNPKPNGYRSLHLILEVPVYMSDRQEHVCMEVQIRTIAMDFWASLEHKIFYKYNQSVPDRLLDELKAAAESSASLDLQMERLHKEISVMREEQSASDLNLMERIVIDNQQFTIPTALLEMIREDK
ncbi:GTP pyrophosphokinase [Paenibacillus tarimensis]|uniref:GTP pyrophosphokinase n=1 Tax=Paenibacillus tarimensis TaxID=416012 RepID=UPI001F28695A|nr:GTP pyrophosphokinase family protein [Paenibacillus tarimensis]MCF2943088.1 GTP pyrophosphokinase family protein [Paenibacillus tarimensis]